ncbi:phage tail protein [Virgibacillus sp. AGTR]|uniref:phage tail protein n=1 Tax=Virgibacillus sp. AGTR TaxID=2812055 RepID=UPI001963569A|nr:phage tail protein [Virgibacillus sp. AGTR]MCC2250087.1 phage tail protein [Virgibacillus sp. AGTR]QRZ17764.1 phage tail protein [Virgibacillus sp. AGTR]
MLSVMDLQGNTEPLVDFQQYTRKRKVNGEKTISMTVVPSENNKHAFPLIGEETTITHGDDEYIIKKYSAKSLGNKYIKRIDGVHKFYVDMINKQQEKVHNGSITFQSYMNLVFENTGYTFATIDSFPAREFDNLGNDNRLSMLEKGLKRFKAEMELVGKQVRFKKMVGNDTDFQFRYGHNIKSIEESCDTTNLATVIRGEGADGITAYYRSPNADIFGEIDAPPVMDERFTSKESLLEEMKARLEDTPLFSAKIDFADLRAAGYPYTVPNEGDRVFVIYEPMNDLILETRILDIDETFDDDLNPIKTTVTLANHKKSFADVVFDNTQKQLGKIINDDGIVRNDVLDQAVQIATEAIKNARTELQFPNEGGIWAVDKDDPNKVVVYNSAGLGVSKDGGQTFGNAITGEGIVAEAIMAGLMYGVNIIQDDGQGGKIELINGVLRTFLNDIPVMKVDEKGLTMFNSSNGGEAGTLRDSQLINDKSKKGISLNSATDFISIGFGRSGGNDFPILHGSKYNKKTSLYRYTPSGNTGFLYAEHNKTTIYAGNGDGRRKFIELKRNTSTNADVFLHYNLHPLGNSEGYNQFYFNCDGYFTGWVSASNVINRSLEKYKTDISKLNVNALSILLNADLYEYKLKSDIENGIDYVNYGLVIGADYNTPEEFLSPEKEGINSYKHRTLNTKAIQELAEENKQLRNEVDDLREGLMNALKRIKALENAG